MSKPCKYCGKDITWDDSQKAFTNPDSSKHDCRTQKLDQAISTKTTPTIDVLVREIVRDELRKMKG